MKSLVEGNFYKYSGLKCKCITTLAYKNAQNNILGMVQDCSNGSCYWINTSSIISEWIEPEIVYQFIYRDTTHLSEQYYKYGSDLSTMIKDHMTGYDKLADYVRDIIEINLTDKTTKFLDLSQYRK